MNLSIFSWISILLGICLIFVGYHNMISAPFMWMNMHLTEKDMASTLPIIKKKERIGWACFILGAGLIFLAGSF